MFSVTFGVLITFLCQVKFGEFELNSIQENHIENLKNKYKKEFIYYPDDNGNPQVMLLSSSPSNKKLTTLYIENNIEFVYYPRRTMKLVRFHFNRNNIPEQKQNLSEIIQNFHVDEELKVIIHGYKSTVAHNMTLHIKEAYLKNFNDVITLDWKNLISSPYYKDCVNNTEIVGKYLAEFINSLIEGSMISASNFHLIGHDFGAHVAAYAAKNIKSGKISRITGLDPARWIFEVKNIASQYLDDTNADFIDIIHTTSSHGYKNLAGHIDFFPNGGVASQPGCFGLKEKFHCCSHQRAYEYFTESISTSVGFYGFKCETFKKFVMGHCTDNPVLLGEHTPKISRGTYYVETNNKSPFAFGKLNCTV